MRRNRDFIVRYPGYLATYQPLMPKTGTMVCPPMVPVLPGNTETDQTGVGRLHYSLRLALSAHFRRGLCASDIDIASWYLSTSRRAGL